ncbi:MAG: HAMP domain-containing protein [Candidatus Methanoperedens sp.]|nr:HAMP domain-containing protein [Candidatus Methanoperedens sp.]
MRLRLKLFIGFIAVSLLVGIVGYLGLYANKQVVTVYESGEEHFSSIIEASNEISSYAKRAEGHTMLFLTLHNETDRQKAFMRITSLREQTAFIEARIKNAEAKKKLEEIKSKTDELQSTVELLFKAYDNEVRTTGRFEPGNHEELIRKLDNLGAGIRTKGLELAKIELNLQDEQQIAAKKDAGSLYNIIFIISAVAIISALALGYIIARNIAGPVNKLREATIDIGKGGLGIRIEIKSKDEIGELAGSFNKMAEDLQ